MPLNVDQTPNCQPWGHDAHSAGEGLANILGRLPPDGAGRDSVSPSFHSLLARSKLRGVDAIVNDATAAPEG